MAIQVAAGLLGILGQIANAAKVPIARLTLKMIQNAPIPVRYKKFLQGKTIGEAMISPSVRSQRAVVPIELQTLGIVASPLMVGGYLIGNKIASALHKNKIAIEKSNNKNTGLKPIKRPKIKSKNTGLKPIKRPKKSVDIRTETEKMSDRIKKRVATKKTIEKTLKTINKKKK